MGAAVTVLCALLAPARADDPAAATRPSDALLALAAGVTPGTSGFGVIGSFRAAPGTADGETSPGGLGLESRAHAYLGRGESGARYVGGYALGVVVVPWAGGAVKPWATLGPGITFAMDLGIDYGGLTAAATVDAVGAVGTDLLLGERRRWGLGVELAMCQPIVQALTVDTRGTPLVTLAVGLRTPRNAGRLDRWAAHLPDFGG